MVLLHVFSYGPAQLVLNKHPTHTCDFHTCFCWFFPLLFVTLLVNINIYNLIWHETQIKQPCHVLWTFSEICVYLYLNSANLSFHLTWTHWCCRNHVLYFCSFFKCFHISLMGAKNLWKMPFRTSIVAIYFWTRKKRYMNTEFRHMPMIDFIANFRRTSHQVNWEILRRFFKIWQWTTTKRNTAWFVSVCC